MTAFGSVKIVGGLLPADLLGRVFAGDPQVPGTGPGTYGLERGESVRRQASRTWLYLLEVWQDFKRRIDGAGNGLDAAEATSARVTRERWLRILLRELGFHQVAGGSFELEGKSFPVSHRSGPVPIHLLGWATDLDHKTPHVSARAPQSMLQELLNRDDAYLWAILSNGATLRLLRDSTALVGSSYVEFDLAAIFDGELFSDFVLLYLACHESRFARQGDGGPETCYLEQWRGFAVEQGQRALDQLRDGVQRAISILGTGFLSHPDNPQLRARLDPRNADLTLDDFNRALLRLVYRILFWFVAEDRSALLQPDPADAGAEARARLREARDRYAAYFSSARLRQLARRRRGGRHGDLFEAMQLVFDALGTEGGVPDLALPGIGGIFEFQRDDGRALPLDEPLAGARLSNEALLGAVRALSQVRPRGGGALRRVDFGNLGAEELGSVYESLLELIPRYDDEQLAYTLETLAGNERKESGSYYTPTSLVECLLDSALDPLLDEACAHGTAEERVTALLGITVCDPACGSGHFLVAAARRIAKRIAAEETGESEPPDPVIRAALRRVVGRCIYGVDVNPMAAELAKVSLWIEALEPGKPLSYLDRSIRVGNSLLGVTPALLAEGLPAAAFTPIEGDDRKVASALKKQNADERQGQHDLFSQAGIPVTNAVLAKRAVEIARALPDSLEDLHIHQQRQALELAESAELRVQKLLADAWCAAFVQPKTAVTRSTAITQAVLERFGMDAGTLELATAEGLVEDLARQYRFFHWHIEFPHIFRVGNGARDIEPTTGWAGGFSCVIGNPPWERVKLQEQEFFASRRPEIASAANAAARKKLIAALADTDSPADRTLFDDFQAELRKAAGWSHLLRESGRYPLTGRGDINTYAVFAETARTVIKSRGRSGLVLPTGIATDATTAPFFGDLVRNHKLVSFLEFENEAFLLSRAVHHSVRFCLLTVCGSTAGVDLASFAFSIRYVRDLSDRRFTMPPEEILLVNPNTGTTPVFGTRRDAEVILGIYRRVPVLWRDVPEENPWGLSFMTMFHMSNDSRLFQTGEQLAAEGWKLNGNVFVQRDQRMLPLYEAKMYYQYDPRYGTHEGQSEAQANVGTLPRLDTARQVDPDFAIMPRYWVQAAEVMRRLPGTSRREWTLVWRNITRSNNERSMICAILPQGGLGHSGSIVTTRYGNELPMLSALNSFVLDYTLRQKLGGSNLSFFIVKQLPLPHPDRYNEATAWDPAISLKVWVSTRVLELTYTTFDLTSFARDFGDNLPPFRWNDERRVLIRAELDAAYFHIYGIERDDAAYIMETFLIVKHRDDERHGGYRTKRLILDCYDAMAEAIRNGEPYQTILDPPAGQRTAPPSAHELLSREEVAVADQQVQRALLVRTALEVLQDADGPLKPRQVEDEVERRVELTPHELDQYADGRDRWRVHLGFYTGDAATVGWITKRNGWAITEAGIEALDAYPTPDELLAELTRLYREIDQRRKAAQEMLSDVQQFIATTLRLVEPSAWTAHDDLAALAGTTAKEVADFLASGKVRLANAYRVLNADGSIPAEGMLNASYRGTDLRNRLAGEGVVFDAHGRAAQDQRLTADSLKELLADRASTEEPETPAAVKRAWMVRGSNVDGYNLVPEWLRGGFVSLSASQLGSLDPGAGYDDLRQAVEAGYQHKSYAYRGQRLEEFDRFLRRMHAGDLVLTPMHGRVYIGEVTGPATFVESAASHSNLRRDVQWFDPDEPVDGSQLRAPVPALLQSQAYIVDLTEAYEQLAVLVPHSTPPEPTATVAEPTRRELGFNPITPDFADSLLMDQAELGKIVDLLWERKQIILYGPPGTGKTYLASKLARRLTDDGAVKLVQFHPSYTYEDFFEGFRPEPGGSGALTFTLRAGPFRDFAEVAADNPSTAYILIIDEINRANLAKVFGELYFLLEYRDESISLQYSPDKEFTLPQNLFLIGTMNTADRSIARIDTAMRRRFAFVELDPRIPPVNGLLGRWLDKHHLPQEAALLLDELNRRIEDSDAAIGPSYLMDERIYQRDDGLDRVWQYSIMPLLEDLFYGQRDLDEHYGLPGLRKAIASPPAGP